jgi:hypothetical protein
MKIATKTLATLLIATVLTISVHTGVAATPNFEKKETKLEKLQQHHDRKLELRASVLSMTADELREELKTKNFTQVIKKRGFKNHEAFHVALAGKMKEELQRRGWSEQKIDALVQKRIARLAE